MRKWKVYKDRDSGDWIVKSPNLVIWSRGPTWNGAMRSLDRGLRWWIECLVA